MRNDSSIMASIQGLLGNDFNLSLFVSIIKKSLVWVIFLFILALTFAYLYLHYTQPLYSTSATLMLNKEKTSQIMGVSNLLSYEVDELQREIEILKSRFLVQRVLKTLPLDVSYFKEGRTKLVSSEMYTSTPFWVSVREVKRPMVYRTDIYIEILDEEKFRLNYMLDNQVVTEVFTFGSYFENSTGAFEIMIELTDHAKRNINEHKTSSFFFRINDNRLYAEQLIAKVKIAPLNLKTQKIQISYQDHNKEKARDIVDAITVEFRKYNVEQKTRGADQILSYLGAQIDTFSKDLADFQDSLKRFRLDNNYLNPYEELNNATERLNLLEQQKVKLMFDQKLVNWFYDYVEELNDLKVISSGLGNDLGNYQSIVDELRRLEQERNQMLMKVSADHPEVVLLEEEIERVKSDLTNNLDNIIKRLNFSMEDVNTQYSMYLGKILEMPEKEAEYARLDRKYKVKEGYYLNLLDKQAEFSIAKAGIVGDYIVLSPAEVGNKPVSPDKFGIWLISLALATVLSIVIIAVRYILHNTIISVDDIANNTKASILGMVPTVYNDIPMSSIVVSNNPKSIVSESLRSLRANLQFISAGDGPKTLAITSTISGEGKTFLAINFGAILSFLNKKVLIMDVDMRRPRLSKIFNASNEKGMSTILIGKDDYHDCIQQTDLANLSFITSGPIPPNPAELILSDKLTQIVEQMKEEYDYIIFDTPPLGLVTDGLDIIKRVDYPIYVFRADYSSKSFIGNLDRLVEENKVTNLSVVLNDVGRGVSGYYYGYGGYGYSYGYGYGFGYYSDETKPEQSFLKRIFNRS